MPEPLYQKILNELLASIENGSLPPGSRLPAEAELEKSWKVSRITVARAMKELQYRGLVYRVRGSGTFVSAIAATSPAAAGPHSPPRFIAAIFPEIERNGIPEILAGVEAACTRAGCLASFHNSRNELALENHLIRQVLDHGCAGLLLYPCFSPLGNANLYSSLSLRGFPLVMLDRSIDVLGLPLFACDNEASMALLCRHVINRGHRRIALVCNSIETISSEQERFRGYGSALLAAGLPLDPALVWRAAPTLGFGPQPGLPAWDARLRLAARALDELLALPDPPSCIMAVNDVLAISLQKAALARGLRIPGDLAITGFDDSDAMDQVEVPLTTIAQPFRQLGQEAVQCLLDKIEGPQMDPPPGGRRIMGELVLRQSV